MTRIQGTNRIWCGKTAKPKPIQTAKTKGRLKPNILKMIKKTETAAARHPPVCLERIMLLKQQKRSSENAIWFELPPKSWTSPPTHKVQFFYEQIYITLQIPSRTPLPAYTQPTAYRRPLRHFPNPPETMDTRLSRRRYRRTRTSPIQNHAPTPQKPLHRR